MSKRTKVSGSAKEMEIAYKGSANPHDHKRLIALQMAQQGVWILVDIGRALSKGRATIGRWLKSYREDGMEGMLERGHGGRKPQLQQDDVEALAEVLGEGKTAKEIRHWLAVDRDIHMTIWGVYYWLGKVKASHKLPGKIHADQDPDEKAAFKENIVDNLQALDIPAGKSVKIWIQDEHRYGLISTIRRCWTLRGHEVRVPYKAEYKWGYVYGALEFITGDAEFVYISSVSLECSYLFLEQLVATDPEAIHIVIWDGAGFHQKADKHELPAQIRLLPLPLCPPQSAARHPYCPELSPIENLWDPVKGEVSNAVWGTLEAMEKAITKVLRPFWESSENVISLLGDNWLTNGVSEFLKLRESLI